MAAKFEIYGPYPVPQLKTGFIDHKAIGKFWSDLDARAQGLSSAVGCYMFAKLDRGYKPWYVGMTKSSFRVECLNPRNQNVLNPILTGRGGLVLFVLPLVTPGTGAYASPGNGKTIEFLETMLIGAAYETNSKLINAHKTALLRNMKIPGFMNSNVGNPGKSAKKFKSALRGKGGRANPRKFKK